MPTTRERVQQMQDTMLELQAGYGEAGIPADAFDKAAIPLGIPARFVIQNQISDSLRKMLITVKAGLWGTDEILPTDAEMSEAEGRAIQFRRWLDAIRLRLDADARAASQREESDMSEKLDSLPPLPEANTVENFKEEVADRMKTVRNWTLFGGSGLVVLAVGTAAAFAIAYAFFQGFLVRAKRAGTG